MLKELILAQNRIPVPVPVQTAAAALDWVEATFLGCDDVITQVQLDGRDLDPSDRDTLAQLGVSASSQLRVTVDTPLKVVGELILSMRELAQAALSITQPLAVALWGHEANLPPRLLREFVSDVEMVIDLSDHFEELIDRSQREVAGMIGQIMLMRAAVTRLRDKIGETRWRDSARAVARDLGYSLRQFVSECDAVGGHFAAS